MFESPHAHPDHVEQAHLVATVARGLAHPARVRIVQFVLAQPGCIGGDIVEAVGLSQSTVSEHLRILRESGIIVGRIERPRVCYTIAPTAVAPLQSLVASLAGYKDGNGPCCDPGCA